MKSLIKSVVVLLASLVLFAACGPKPQYKTRLGKKKLKHYNSIQYDKGDEPKSFKSFKNRKK